MKTLATFRVAGSRYALPGDVIAECVEGERILYRVPTLGESRLGVASVRGRWLPVLELADAIVDVPRLEPQADSTVILVLGRGSGRLGLRVDAFDGVVDLVKGVNYDQRADDMVELDGALLRYVDPAVLLASGRLFSEKDRDPMEDNRETSEPLQVIAFRVGGEEFGIDVMKVERVLRTPEIRPVPQSPEFVEGVVSVQEDVVPVIDMRKRFSVPQTEWVVPGALLVARIATDRVALVVDEVPGLARLSVESLSPAPEFFKGLAGRYLDGIAQQAGRLIVLLNLDEILGSQERIALGEMIEAAKAESVEDESNAVRPSRKTKKKRGGGRPKKKSSS